MSAETNPLEAVMPDGELTEPEFRQWICEIERRMCCVDGAFDRHTKDTPCPATHTFTPGLYTREIFMPKGVLIISRIHMFEHPFVISQGDVSVYDGKSIARLKAPHMGITQPGTKRILYTHEDTRWTTFHVTDKEGFDEIDEPGVITCDTFDDFNRLIRKEIAI